MELTDLLNQGWGPTEDTIPSFSGLPFTPFSKHDTINFIANWDTTSRTHRRSRRPRTKFGDDENAALQFEDSDLDDGFEGGITVKKRTYETIAKYKRDRTKELNKLTYSQNRNKVKEQQRIQDAPASRRGTRRQVQNKRRRKRYIENQRPTIPSIKKLDTWIDLTDIWFRETFEEGYGNNSGNKFIFKINGEDSMGRVYTPKNKKLILSGLLHGVLTKYDMLNGNTYQPQILNYEKFSDYKFLHFNYKSTTQDPYILELAQKRINKTPTIYTTDNVLSAIMCCNRSKYSFDIVINKIGQNIFLDERNKILSNYSVDETSQHRPTKKGTSRINQYMALSQEATYINHVFREQMVYHNKLEYTQKLKRQHPFINEINGNQSGKGGRNKKKKKNKSKNSGQEPASQAFSYNLYEVTDTINVICRCAIDGFTSQGGPGSNNKGGYKDWVKIYALNQYDSNRSKTQNWRKYLDTKISTILSQEVTNNNFKCARWGICAHLADAKYIKMGFVARNNVHSTEKHMICGVKTYETRDFIRNKLRIRSTNEPWTIFAKFIRCIQNLQDDGRYIAVRDPLKQVIRMFKVSNDSFAELPSFPQLKKLLNVKDKANNSKKKTAV